MVAALLLASCATAVSEEEEAAPSQPPKEEEVAKPTEEEVVPSAEEPTYGGVFRYAGVPLLGFDPALVNPWANYALNFTNEELLTGDWAKGMSGTGEAGWRTDEFFLHLATGVLAESWEVVDDETVIFHIRKGIRWHNKPPVNGREFVADDVVFSINRMYASARAYLSVSSKEEERPTFTASDKYTVVAKLAPGLPPARLGEILRLGDLCRMVPREVIDEYEDMNDWENVCGTGPFMLVDYISGSSATFERNPGYWRKDPLHPENTLPYLDGIKMLFIPDASTVLAAVRTGKIDYLLDVQYEDAQSLMKTNPSLQWLNHLRIYNWDIYFRIDKPELPFADVRVRQALAMAIDRQLIVDEYYRGYAEILAYPLAPVTEFMDAYTPIEELPEVARETYEYHPDKARQLLAEAGYPDGFKTKIVCYTASVDDLSMIKAYWADVGVDLELDVKEWGVYSSMAFGRSSEGRARYDEMVYRYAGLNTPTGFLASYQPWDVELSGIDDPRLIRHREQLMLNQMDWAKIAQTWKEYAQFAYEQVWSIDFPTPYVWTMWQPWVKGYNAERGIGFHNEYNTPIYLWIDQDLKEEMTGTR